MTNELYHYGVKGMKWGVRKDRIGKAIDRNGDRYRRVAREGSSVANASAEGLRKVGSSRMSKKRTSDMKNMSDKELRDKINRMNMEQQYSRMVSSESKVNRGRDFAVNSLQIAGAVLGVGASAMTIAISIREMKK